MDKIKLPLQRLDAAFAADTANDEERTVDILWYSGAPVLQFSWENGLHELTLSLEKGACDTKKLNSGRAPFTLGHASTNDPLSVIGSIVKGSVSLEDGGARATVKFSDRPEVAAIFGDIKAGILSNVSMEASILKLKEITEEKDKMKRFLATRWEPSAVALVAQGADSMARVLASAESECECEVEFSRASAQMEKVMNDQNIASAGEQARVDTDAVKLAAAAAERKRIMEITELGTRYGLAALAGQAVENGTSRAEFGEVVLAELAKKQEAEQSQQRAHVHVVRDEADTRRTALSQAILFRANPQLNPLTDKDPGNEVRGIAMQGLIEVAKVICRANGKATERLSPNEIVRFALSTSDLPYVLENVAHRSLQAGYAKQPSRWTAFSARKSAPNFKAQSIVQLGVQTGFDAMAEGGEYKVGYLSDSKETWQLLTYGKQLNITRQTIINDDLGALTDVPMQMGMKAAIKQASLVFSLLTTNKMSDGATDVFSSGHANYTSSGTAISVESLGVGRAAMRAQTDPSGDLIDIEPKFLIVSPTKEQLALQYTSQNYVPATAATQNVWAPLLTPIADGRLSGNAWYLFADPAVAPVIVYGYLDGNEGIYSATERMEGDAGLKFFSRMDFGCAVVDYRGAYLNAGA